MSKMNTSRIAYILGSMLLGMASFMISGVIACLVILLLDNYIVATIIAGGIGGLFLGLLLQMRQKTGRMAIAGIIGMPISLIISFLLVEGFGLLFPSIGMYFENSAIPDISAIVLMGIIFGAVVGLMIYGRISIWLFSAVCGTISIPFGLLVGAMNSGHYIKAWLENLSEVFGKIDINFLAITISLGIGIGLSIGLYNMKTKKYPTVHPERYNDPVAMNCSWRCLKSGSANFTTHRLFRTADHDLVYRSTILSKIIGIFFIIVGTAMLVAYFAVIIKHWTMPVFGLIFVISGTVIFVQSIIPIGFDSRKGLFYRGWRQKGCTKMSNQKYCVSFNQIHAIQLLKKIGRVSSSSENFHEDRYFYAYELNLVLHNGARKYIMTYINLEQALADAEQISQLVGVPVWNGMATK